MSDILEVVVTENPFEIVFNDQPLEVLVQEDNYEVSVTQNDTEVLISSEDVEILTIAEQGPPGVGGGTGGLFDITVSSTAPLNPVVGQLWLDTN
jgi:hypothetical protein